MLDLYFRDESEDVSRKVNAKNNKKTRDSSYEDSHSNEHQTPHLAFAPEEIKPNQQPPFATGYQYLCVLSITPNPSRDTNSEAINYFLGPFLEASHFEYLRGVDCSASDQEPLAATTRSAAMASLAIELREPRLMNAARSQYAHALASTNAALRHPEDAVKDSTLISVLLLGLFEILAFEGRQSPDNWTAHTQGAAALIQLRGKSQFETELGRRLFLQVANNMRLSSVQRKVHLPLDFLELESQALTFMDRRDPLLRLSSLTDSLTNLRADMAQGRLVDAETIIERALKINKDAMLLIDGVLPSYDILEGHQAPSWSFRSTAHRYPNLRAALFWNSVRMIRLFVNEWIYQQTVIILRDAQTQSWNSASQGLRDLQSLASEVVQQMVLDILASIPQFTHLATNSPPLSSRFLILPLSAAGETCLCPPDARAYIINSLRILGNLSRVPQALRAADMLEETKPLEDWYVSLSASALNGRHNAIR